MTNCIDETVSISSDPSRPHAGLKYKYFMVFLKDGDAVQGALKVDAFLNTLEKL